MSEESTLVETGEKKHEVTVRGGGSSPVYGLGMIGAWMYYFKRASTPQERLHAFFKGLVWPVFLVRDLLVSLEKK